MSPPSRVPWWSDWLSGLQARHPQLAIRLGNLETRALQRQLAGLTPRAPIYVTGLARAGTTIVLELLARHPALASHRYRDFPLLTLPWSWNWFVDRAGGNTPPAEERAHRDGIFVTRESPEAFEEMLWLAFFPAQDDDGAGSAMGRDDQHPEFERFYRDHLRKLLLVRRRSRYLSKANYHLTRLPWLLACWPDARFVVAVRQPAWHIASLMRQHELFCAEHRRDPRTRNHMARCGHFEFGLDRRPIRALPAAMRVEIAALWREGSRAAEIEGWARYWAALHEHLVRTLRDDAALRRATLVLSHETLCEHPVLAARRMLQHCTLPLDEHLTAHAAATLHAPAHGRPPFDDDELALIDRHTRHTHERVARIAQTIAGGLVD